MRRLTCKQNFVQTIFRLFFFRVLVWQTNQVYLHEIAFQDAKYRRRLRKKRETLNQIVENYVIDNFIKKNNVIRKRILNKYAHLYENDKFQIRLKDVSFLASKIVANE